MASRFRQDGGKESILAATLFAGFWILGIISLLSTPLFVGIFAGVYIAGGALRFSLMQTIILIPAVWSIWVTLLLLEGERSPLAIWIPNRWLCAAVEFILLFIGLQYVAAFLIVDEGASTWLAAAATLFVFVPLYKALSCIPAPGRGPSSEAA